MNIYEFYSKPEQLAGHNDKMEYLVPDLAVNFIKDVYGDGGGYDDVPNLPRLESTIAKDPYASYNYASEILDGPFPEGEPTIAKSANLSLRYAIYIIRKRFPLGEDIISKDPQYAWYYVRDIIKGRWEKGEKAILSDPETAKQYNNLLRYGSRGEI